MAVVLKHLSILTCVLFLNVGVFFPEHAEAFTPETYPYRLTYLPERVIKDFTENVRIRCERDASVVSKLGEIDRIRIMKQTHTGRWWTVAQIKEYNGEVEADEQVNATGWADFSKVEAFLEITWPLAKQAFGVYKCDVIGFDKHLHYNVEATSEVVIEEQDAKSADLLNFMKKFKADMKAKVQENAEKLKELKEEEKNKIVFHYGKDYLVKDRILAWPTGEYGLPQPRSGCPVDLTFYGGDTGYIRFKVDPPKSSSFIVHGIYSQLNLAAPILGKTSAAIWLSLQFCVVTRVFSTAPWPEGSYCIHQKGQACPDTFQSTSNPDGITGVDDNKFTYGGILPNLKPSQLCCKDSGSPDVPIALPTENPFYLYRHGSVCQQVLNMDVTPEDVRFQPLEIQVPVTLSLCYYAKRAGNVGN